MPLYPPFPIPLAAGLGGTGVSALGTGVATAFGQNVTGSGGFVLATNAVLTPTSVNGLIITTTTGTFTLTNGKTLGVSNTLTFTGTDASSIAFGAGGTIGAVGYSATGQVAGTATNDSAAAGKVGEIQTASLAAGSAVSLTTDVAKTVTSISLTAGDWDVSGFVTYVKAGTTVVFSLLTSISETTNTRDSTNESVTTFNSLGETLASDPWTPAPVTRKSLAATTTIYLIAQGGFNTSTLSAWGTIRARRAR